MHMAHASTAFAACHITLGAQCQGPVMACGTSAIVVNFVQPCTKYRILAKVEINRDCHRTLLVATWQPFFMKLSWL